MKLKLETILKDGEVGTPRKDLNGLQQHVNNTNFFP